MVRVIKAQKVLVFGDFDVEELPEEPAASSAEIIALREEAEKLARLLKIVSEIYIINEKGGQGSRREVRDLLAPYVTQEVRNSVDNREEKRQHVGN